MGFAATRSVRTYHGSLPRRFKSALAHTSRGTKSSSITIAALTSPAHNREIPCLYVCARARARVCVQGGRRDYTPLTRTYA